MADNVSNIAGNATSSPQIASAAVGSATSGLFGLLGQLVGYGLQKKLAQQQNQYNLEMWNLQNEYNSPQAQMQRFAEAGLNPNLIYGQGTSGNSSSAPQMVTPNAPNISKEMMELGKAFNIENLRTLVANRKKAEAEAQNATVNANRNTYQLEAERHFGNEFAFDPVTGSYIQLSADKVWENNQKDLRSSYYLNKLREQNYIKTRLIPFRAALYEQQKNYLVPQTQMMIYQQQKQPVTFWVDTVGKGIRSAGEVVNWFNPRNWLLPRNFSGGYFNPYTGTSY